MNKDETIQRLDMVRFRLTTSASELVLVGKNSDQAYQAKCDRYANRINELIENILEDEFAISDDKIAY